eukprot:scaffold13756_cov54-Attheya_sp.AAC.1
MSMNIFRLTGDMCHLFSILLVLHRLLKQHTAEGISLRTHELFLVVFCARYLDVFTLFYSLYNCTMKLFYIASSGLVVCLIRWKGPLVLTYDRARDDFPHWKYCVLPAALLSILSVNKAGGLEELLWTFSIYLEVTAVVPQLVLLQQYRRDIDNTVTNYILFMGMYRALYCVNWVYRSYVEPNKYRHNYLVYTCGVLQTLVYSDFFYCYIKSKAAGEESIQYETYFLNRLRSLSCCSSGNNNSDSGNNVNDNESASQDGELYLLIDDDQQNEDERAHVENTIDHQHESGGVPNIQVV